MPSPWNAAAIAVDQPHRGPGNQAALQFFAQSAAVTWSFGAAPATGEVDYVSTAGTQILAGAQAQITLFGRTFYGFANGGTASNASSGRVIKIEFVDNREYLKWDQVFCVFNKEEVRYPGGVRKVRYWHILPINWRRAIRTYTPGPYTAAQILDFIFQAPTVGTTWWRRYHLDQFALPVYDIDCDSGKRLDEVLVEISEAQGLVFTLMGGPFTLTWFRKGEGILPPDPFPVRSDNQNLGTVVSGNPTRIFVVGDRNLYQVMDVVLRPDWNANYEEFLDLGAFEQDIFTRAKVPGTNTLYKDMDPDPENIRGRLLSRARALEITVAEYAALRTDKDFSDGRRFGGRSRGSMPVALYLTQLVFRAFRPPQFVNLPNPAVSATILQPVATDSLDIVDQMVARVTHDEITGAMTAHIVNPNSPDPLDGIPDSAGWVIVQGAQAEEDLFEDIRPERFDAARFLQSQEIWRRVGFTLDQSGEDGKFLILEEPVFKSADLIATIDGYAVIKANATLAVGKVKAALTFAAERFFSIQGSGSRDDKVNVNGLHGEGVIQNGVVTYVPYADGLFPDGNYPVTKAGNVARALLARQYWYHQGSYERKLLPGDTILDLSGVIDRVTLACSSQGQVESVNFTRELGRLPWIPEREFDRKARSESLLPGQAELRAAAETNRRVAAGLKLNPALKRKVQEKYRQLIGLHGGEKTITHVASGTGTLPAGTPLWGAPMKVVADKPTQTRAVMPTLASSSHPDLKGITMRHNEKADLPIRVKKTGEVPVRVQGPVAVGDTLVKKNGADYLVGSEAGDVDAPVVGVAQQDIAHEEVSPQPVKLIMVMLGKAGGGGGTGEALWA